MARNWFKKIDIYGKGVGFNIRGEDTYKTGFGAFLSLLTALALSVYAFDKFLVLIQRGDTVNRSVTMYDTLDWDREYSLEEIGLSGMVHAMVIVPTYYWDFEVEDFFYAEAKIQVWYSDGTFADEPVEMIDCPQEILDRYPESRSYTMSGQYKYAEKCLDETKEVKLKGSNIIGRSEQRTLHVYWKIRKDLEESQLPILKSFYLGRTGDIRLESTFSTEKYFEDTIQLKERLTHHHSFRIPQNTTTIDEMIDEISSAVIINHFQLNEIDRRDDFMLFFKAENDIFFLRQREFLANDVARGIIFEEYFVMNIDSVLHSREVYNILDYIGDVGGLMDGIKYLFMLVIEIYSVLGERGLSVFLVLSTFRKRIPSPDSEDLPKLKLKSFLVPFLHRRKIRILQEGQDRIDKQLDITRFLYKHKMLWTSFKAHTSPAQIRRFERTDSFTIVVKDNSSGSEGKYPQQVPQQSGILKMSVQTKEQPPIGLSETSLELSEVPSHWLQQQLNKRK